MPRDVALCVNLGPQTRLTSRLPTLLHGRNLTRIVLGITEHAPVRTTSPLPAALEPYRAAGLRLAVDDARAG